MRDAMIRRAHTDPRLTRRLHELADTISEATGHKIEIAVIGYSPPVFAVDVDTSRVDDWMPWEQTIMFLRGLIAGFEFDNPASYNEGVAASTAKVQQALQQALSQDRDADTSVDASTP